MQKYDNVLQDRQGTVITGATITVKDYPAGTTAAVYATDVIGTTVNPLTSANDGTFSFYAKDGLYTLDISRAGISSFTYGPILIQDTTTILSVQGLGTKADGIVDDTAKFTAAFGLARHVEIPPGSYLISSTPTTPGNIIEVAAGATLTGSGATALGVASATGGKQVLHHGTTHTDYASVYYRRQATHTTGSAGTVASAFRAETYVTGNAGNYEWTATFKMDSSAAAGQNVAVYGQGIRRSTGPVWAGCLEAMESADVNNPAAGTVGLEVDVRSGGTDASANRVGIDVVGSRRVPGAGTATQTGWGVRLQDAGEGVNHLFFYGFGLNTGTRVFNGFDTSKGTVLSSAFIMADGQTLAWTAAGTTRCYHDATGLVYEVGGTIRQRLRDDGGFLSTGAVVGASVTSAYSASIAVDAATGNTFVIAPTDGVAFTINAPSGGTAGQFVTFNIRNATGGALGAATWNAVFKMAAWTQPATGFSRSITFRCSGANFTEISRTTVDIPN